MKAFSYCQAGTTGNAGHFFVPDSLAQAITPWKSDEDLVEPQTRSGLCAAP
jgi:hypothetical protein